MTLWNTLRSVATYRHAASILAAKGKRLVVSLKNGYRGATPVNAKIGVPCAVHMVRSRWSCPC